MMVFLIIILQCPFCHKNDTVDAATEDKTFCIEKVPDGRNQLKRNHASYYQVHFAILLYTVLLITILHVYNAGSSAAFLHWSQLL